MTEDGQVRLQLRRPWRDGTTDIVFDPSPEQIAGVYLHRRANRQNGGVAYILGKTLTARISGTITLQESEANDLKTGKFYVSAVAKNPRLSARANLVLPSA